MTAYADIHFTQPTDVTVAIHNRYMVVVEEDRTKVCLSDFRDSAVGVGDLIARMFETLASAPGLTEHERAMVRERMCRAMQSTYWDRVENEAESIEDRVICFTKVPGGFCVLDQGHDEGCANVRTVVGA